MARYRLKMMEQRRNDEIDGRQRWISADLTIKLRYGKMSLAQTASRNVVTQRLRSEVLSAVRYNKINAHLAYIHLSRFIHRDNISRMRDLYLCAHRY